MIDDIYMGNSTTKSINISKIKVPNDHLLLKIATINVELYNFITARERVEQIIQYIFKNKLDIICLQGITDLNIGIILIRKIKERCMKKNIILHFSPSLEEIDIINDTRLSSKKMFEISWGKTQSKNLQNKLFIKNIIISRYPISEHIFEELDKETDIDDLLGIQTLVGANINIENTIVPIYCTSLSKDIKTTDIINNDVRKTEIDEICNFIRSKKHKYSLILGSFYINEINDNEPNQEFLNMVQNHKIIDIYRYKNDNNPGFTTRHMERHQYIFILLRKMKIFDDYEKLLNYIYKKYGVHFIECYVNNEILIGKNYPIECIFMIQKK